MLISGSWGCSIWPKERLNKAKQHLLSLTAELVSDKQLASNNLCPTELWVYQQSLSLSLQNHDPYTEKRNALSRESHPEHVCQHFCPSAVGVGRNADEELPPREEDVTALQRGPSEVGLLGVHLHHCQLQLGHHPLHCLCLQRRRENTRLQFYWILFFN